MAFECEPMIPHGRVVPDGVAPDPNFVFVWAGSERLAAHVPADGHWTAMGSEYNYRDKFWWWGQGYNAHSEPQPKLIITAKRLDKESTPLIYDHASNAFAGEWNLMLLAMEFPSAGCWEVIGEYQGESLRFVFRVSDKPTD